jgi:SNF2 family DNA or RNA helicase
MEKYIKSVTDFHSNGIEIVHYRTISFISESLNTIVKSIIKSDDVNKIKKNILTLPYSEKILNKSKTLLSPQNKVKIPTFISKLSKNKTIQIYCAMILDVLSDKIIKWVFNYDPDNNTITNVDLFDAIKSNELLFSMFKLFKIPLKTNNLFIEEQEDDKEESESEEDRDEDEDEKGISGITNIEIVTSLPLPQNKEIVRVKSTKTLEEKLIRPLYPYQMDCVKWGLNIEKNGPLRGGIFCLEMGLGKTAISLYMSQVYDTVEPKKRCSLIVCTNAIMGEFINDAKSMFGDDLNILLFHSSYIKDINNITLDVIDNYDLVITTYDVIMRGDKKSKNKFSEKILIRGDDGLHKDKIVAFKQVTKPPFNCINEKNEPKGAEILYAYEWYRVVADETARIRNWKTAGFKSLCSIYGTYKWCLTGTPISNGATDLWSLCFFMGMTQIINPKNWDYKIYKKYNLDKTLLKMTKNDPKVIEAVGKIPDLTKMTVTVDMDKDSFEVYKYFFQVLWDVYNEFIKQASVFAGVQEGFAKILGLFVRLRQICIAPYLITDESKPKHKSQFDDGDEEILNLTNLAKALDPKIHLYESFVHNKRASGFNAAKIKKIVEIVKSIPKGEKILIYSSFGAVLKLVYEALIDTMGKKVKITVINGETNGKLRHEIINNFKNSQDCDIALINFRVGAEGLNLQVANHVILCEPWWNPTVEDQAIARCHRLGQKKPVRAYSIITRGTIEEMILKLCKDKSTLASGFINCNAEQANIKIRKLDKNELGRILRGSYNLFLNK